MHRPDRRRSKDPARSQWPYRHRHHYDYERCRCCWPVAVAPDIERRYELPCRLPRRPEQCPKHERESRPPWGGAKTVQMPTALRCPGRPPPLPPWVGPPSCFLALRLHVAQLKCDRDVRKKRGANLRARSEPSLHRTEPRCSPSGVLSIFEKFSGGASQVKSPSNIPPARTAYYVVADNSLANTSSSQYTNQTS